MAFKGQNQRGVCQRERMKGDCKIREVKREWMVGDGEWVLADFIHCLKN